MLLGPDAIFKHRSNGTLRSLLPAWHVSQWRRQSRYNYASRQTANQLVPGSGSKDRVGIAVWLFNEMPWTREPINDDVDHARELRNIPCLAKQYENVNNRLPVVPNIGTQSNASLMSDDVCITAHPRRLDTKDVKIGVECLEQDCDIATRRRMMNGRVGRKVPRNKILAVP